MSKEKMLAMQKQVTGKLMAAISMLLVSAILMCLTSYAWFILSTAPEVSNLKTTAGANGALEIALQSTNKDGTGRADITSAVGSSHAKNSATVSNTYWGNVVDLTEGYGLEHVTLYPSRLKLNPVGDSYTVDTGTILQVPQFGQDGRVTGLLDATKTHYDGGKFTTGNNWGVNVLGAVSEKVGEEDTIVLTYARDIVLEQAREKVAAYRTELRDKMERTIADNAMGIMGLFIAYGGNAALPAPPDTSNDAVENYVSAMEVVVADATQALRWALLARAAADEDTYKSENDEDMKALGALYAAVMQMPLTGDTSIYSVATANGYEEIANAATAMAASVRRVEKAAGLVKDGDLTGAGAELIAMDQTFMYGHNVANKDQVENVFSATKYNFQMLPARVTDTNPYGLATEDTIFTVAHKSDPTQMNLFSSIASVIGDYFGDMNVWLKFEQIAIGNDDYESKTSWVDVEPVVEGNVLGSIKITYTIKATSGTAYGDWEEVENLKDAEGNYINTPRMGVLGQLSKKIAEINAPGTIQVKITRSDVMAYGYSIDLAFKSSQKTDLLLQQLGITRVSSDTTGSDTEDPATLGGGSTMEFTVAGDMTEEQIRGMLQGLYIVFMNSDTGAIYKVAALDPASITVNWAAMPVTATGTLALYEPTFGADGTLSLGSKVGDNVITALAEDTELDMTAVVYLSGDAVDSTVFSATQGLSLNGGVNLQFASSTALTPMNYDFTAAETKRKDD